jgi:hypothetical protein
MQTNKSVGRPCYSGYSLRKYVSVSL